jgi:D-alanyl-lipoteichoic acid acyltransferase DltB (MBOAT superfamily)
VIADNVAVIADKTFQLQDPGVGLLMVGVLAFGIQILADFSGYTDIARGSARLLGIRLSHNFDSPYLSASPSEFWRRWHMSLSSWFRDYVYIPLGGSRAGRWGNVATLLGTFLLVGLWHGAAWNFILWGGYHGLLIQGHRSLASRVSLHRHIARYGGIAVTFVLIHVGWFLFRADDLSIVWDAITAQADGRAVGGGDVTAFLFFQVVVYAVLLSAPVLRGWLTPTGTSSVKLYRLYPAVLNTGAATAMFFGILTLRSQVSIDFIYFQF